MRSYRRKPGTRRGGRDGSFWLSFSDLMSSLVLIIILVMFYIIYQYFNLAEINEAEIARREYQLDVAQTELEDQKSKLSDAEKQMIAQQILLDAKQKELDDAQEVLETQRSELETTQAQLDELGAQLADQQAQLVVQQTQLEDAQAQLVIRETQLEEAQGQLVIRETQLEDAQAQLVIRETQLEEAQGQLVIRETQLEEAQGQLVIQQTQLEEAQGQLVIQQTQLEEAQGQLVIQQTQLDQQQAQLEQLIGMKPRIIASLSSALREADISATVDVVTGSIALESDVLFESGMYDLSDAGRRFVDQFLPVYLDVLFSDEYRGYVSEIIIEGHTDSDGGYISNLELSQQRALAVASYVLGEECRTVSADTKNELRPVVTVNGRSFSDRIFDANGAEDKAASRRVVFKFRLIDEQMILQMQQILEAE